MKRLTTFACLAVALMFAVGAFADGRIFDRASQPTQWTDPPTNAKASGDTVDLMGPNGLYEFIGDFQNQFQTARPTGSGVLMNGWTAVDETHQPNYFHLDTYRNPFTDKAAWCGDIEIVACDETDVDGGYLANWVSILEFRKTVGTDVSATVRVQADLQYHSEPDYDYTYLQRRTEAQPDYEPIEAPGQGLSWDGGGIASDDPLLSPTEPRVDYTFTYVPADLLGGDEICVGFVFVADGGYDDGDCNYPSDGACRLDNMKVTVTVDDGVNPVVVTEYLDDFDGVAGLGNWNNPEFPWVGSFARVWTTLGDADECASNYTKLLAFIDDGLVEPALPGTVGLAGGDYGPPGGYIVNNTGGLLGVDGHINNAAYSPVMQLPAGKLGVTLAFDCYRHELVVQDDTPGIYYYWNVRSGIAGANMKFAGWTSRNFYYYGGPNYIRSVNNVTDLIVPDAAQVQVNVGCIEWGWAWGYGNGTNGTPAPYFDNISVKAYPTNSGPRVSVTDIYLAQDGFPGIKDIDWSPTGLGNNSVRFDMARNIAPRSHVWNDPGDSIWCEATPRSGGALNAFPRLYWKFAYKNPLFTDAERTAIPGVSEGSVAGKYTYIWGVAPAPNTRVKNRFNFELPDTGMLFPGDVLHYYFSATDVVGTDVKQTTVPANLAGFGNATPGAFPSLFVVNCLPTMTAAVAGSQPTTLFWNDFGDRGGEDEWYGALTSLGLERGVDYDVYQTKGPSSGVGNGLGGRAVLNQIKYYTDMLYTAGDLNQPTLSNGDPASDAGNDLGLLNEWFAENGRDLFMTGDDLGSSLSASGPIALAFLEEKMGVQFNDTDVRDNIGGQTAPLVVVEDGNPVFDTAASWIAYGGCFGINDFDNVQPFNTGVRLAEFTDGSEAGASPYPYSAAVLNEFGTNRIISTNHDFYYITTPGKSAAPLAARAIMLSNVLDYFGVANDPGTITGTDLPVARFGVDSYPNPFNPSLTIKYTLKNPGNVVMKVYNVRGELVKTLLNGFVETPAPIVWDGSNEQGGSVSSGVYFVETRSGGDVNVQKATMVK